MSYHHGALRESVLAAAAIAIERDGVAALSLRSLARDIGVTHAAPRHHFGDKRGVLTALATQGYDWLTERITAIETAPRTAVGSTDWIGQRGLLLEAGVVYVEFAVAHPAHFAVLFRPDLVDTFDPALIEAQDRLGQALERAVARFGGGAGAPQRDAAAARSNHSTGVNPSDGDGVGFGPDGPLALAAWSLAHGFATLLLSGALDDQLRAAGGDVAALTRSTLRHLAP